MIAVVAIVAVLATVATPLLEVSAQRAKEVELRRSLRALRTAIDDYKRASDKGLIAKAADATGYPPTLQALTAGVPDATSPDRARRLYFLRRLPRDPFADPQLTADQTWVVRSSDSPPDAPRQGADVFDVSSGSERLALDGTRYQDW